MKKLVIFLCCAVMLLVVTGCGKKNQVVCSKTAEEEGQKMTVEVTVDFDSSDKATNASMVYDFEDKTLAETFCNLFKESDQKDNISCSGTKITIKDLDAFEDEEEEDSEKVVGQSKEDVLKTAEEEGFTCK